MIHFHPYMHQALCQLQCKAQNRQELSANLPLVLEKKKKFLVILQNYMQKQRPGEIYCKIIVKLLLAQNTLILRLALMDISKQAYNLFPVLLECITSVH